MDELSTFCFGDHAPRPSILATERGKEPLLDENAGPSILVPIMFQL